MRKDHTITHNSSDGGRREGTRGPESKVSKRTFVGTVGVALTVLMLLLLTTISMNAVTAAFSPGIGGFNATFLQLNYNESGSLNHNGDAHIYPTSTPDTAACPGLKGSPNGSAGEIPVLTADIPGTVGVNGLFLKKTIPVDNTGPNVIFGPIDNITLNITAAQDSEIALSQPTLLFSSLSANELNLSGGVAIYENHSNGSSSAPYIGEDGEFHINATNLEVDGATAFAHLVAFDQIKLPNQELSLEFNNRNAAISDDGCDI